MQAIDSELSAFAAQRERYRLLEDVCASLETLERLGAAPTFWGDQFDQPAAAEHVRAVRGRVAEYAEQVRIAEDKRRSILEGITQGGDVLAILEGDLLDVEDEEIERSLEWVVDRELGPVPERPAAAVGAGRRGRRPAPQVAHGVAARVGARRALAAARACAAAATSSRQRCPSGS